MYIMRSTKCSVTKHQEEDPDYAPGACESDSSLDSNSSKNKQKQIKLLADKINNLSDVIIVPPASSQNIHKVCLASSFERESTSDTNIPEFINNILQDIVNMAAVSAETKMYTKKGDKRKRRQFEQPLTERKRQKVEDYARKHYVKKACKCKMNCARKIKYTRQKDINRQYWLLPKDQQRQFALSCVKRSAKQRNTTKKETSRRVYSYKYYLTSEKREEIEVCKTFLLATLGYEK